MSFRILFLALFPLFGSAGQAQKLSGGIEGIAVARGIVRLDVARGGGHVPLDSVRVGPSGTFHFNTVLPGAGFYQLVVNDTDRVDLILDPRETEVMLEFTGTPLQRHIRVVRSEENQRLWEYKVLSKETQAISASVAQQRAGLAPTDQAGALALDSVLSRAMRSKRSYLASVMREAPEGFFARAIRADQALDTMQGKNPLAVAEVFDFSDAALMRSAVYDRAVMVFLQNLNAVSEGQFVVASDTLMGRAAKVQATSAYMLEHLLDLFTTYGPEMAAAHLVDRYIATGQGTGAFSPELQAKVAAYLEVSIGAEGPDIVLTDASGALPLSLRIDGAPRTVLFFYSSTCDHCHAEMPGLKAIHSAYAAAGLKIFGIALDTDSAEFEHCIRENALPWPGFSEFNGWGSSMAKAYHVRATPSFFLLDEHRIILAKPVDAADLANKLQE
ncbi:MAG TPA: TlpA disulfide reductase family protein [Flavobacteriales bacterium]